MAKRPPSAEEALEASLPKRRQVQTDECASDPQLHSQIGGARLLLPENHDASLDYLYDENAAAADNNNNDDDDDDDDYNDDGSENDSSMATPDSSSANIESPITAATTPRTKFPSDYKTLACTWPGCTKTFNRPARLRDHMNSHTNSRPHKCPYAGCDKDYIEDKHLKQHIKSVHKNERRYACARPGCGKSFVTGTRLKRHQAVHEGADRFRCGDCGQSFRKRETLGKHVRREHLGQSAYPCGEPGCARGFDTKPALQRHRQREHGELRFWCAECGAAPAAGTGSLEGQDPGQDQGRGRGQGQEQERGPSTAGRVGFTTEAALQQHMRTEHQNCLFCDYKSTSQWEFQTHIDIHHSGKTLEDRRTVPCPYPGCSKRFTKRSNLNVHIRAAHEGVRFVCGETAPSGPDFASWSGEHGCGAKFSTKVRLEDHIRFIHLGLERPRLSAPAPPPKHPADLIDELAGINNIKRQAIRCPTCDEGFSRYFDLNLHIAKFHGPNPADDDHDDAVAEAMFAPENIFMQQHDDPSSENPGAENIAGLLPPAEEGFQHATCAQQGLGPDHDNLPWTQAALFQEEEIFAAARMEYDLPTVGEDWFGDDPGIMTLAHDDAGIDYTMDPSLGISF